MSRENKQSPVRYFWKPDNIKKEDDLTREDLIAEIEAAGDDGDLSREREWCNLPIFSMNNVERNKVEREIPGENSTDKLIKRRRQRRRLCNDCCKELSCRQALWKHRKTCKDVLVRMSEETPNHKYIKPITLKWNGRSWESRSKNLYYQMNLGRDLSNLLERGAIKDDALNSSQREYIRMYKSLFKS